MHLCCACLHLLHTMHCVQKAIKTLGLSNTRQLHIFKVNSSQLKMEHCWTEGLVLFARKN